ncbi:MAG: glycosyl hydrolase [Saprospiraceae bacterium]|nr:glycosyl hydrolase [Saprospiraceae bacterium]
MKKINFKHLSYRGIVLGLLCLFVFPEFMGAQISASQLEGLQYRSIGPSRGGRVTAVAGVPDQLFTFYMGATGGGVWKTTDGGLTWGNISDGFFEVGSIGAIEVAPSDPNVVYVGTGSADPRGNVSPGKGIYKSTDGGDTWTFIGLEKAGQIGKLAIHPNNPDIVYAAVLGNVFGPNPERGVYRTTDGGKTWDKVHYVSDKTGCIDLAMDPNNPRILFAAMWTAERKPWTFIDGSEEGGVWKSTDGGDSWQNVEGGLPGGLLGRIGVTVSPVNSKRVWVLLEAAKETDGGLYESTDGGQTWERINRDHQLRQRAWYYTRIFAHPKEEHTVYVVNVSFLKSIDSGKSFQRIRVPHGDNHNLWINPHHPEVMIEANDGGACVTFNGGQTWTTQNNQTTAEFYRVTVDNQFPYRVYGAQQDNSTMSVPSRWEENLDPIQSWYEVGGGESGHIAVDPRNPDLIYAGTYIGQITRKDRQKGHTRDVVAYPQMHDGTAPRDIKYRFQWNAPIRLSPHDPNVLYHCSQYVHRSPDGGRTWEVISPDLTTDNDAYHNIPGEPIQHDHTGVELYTTIFAFEESPATPGELWAGSDDGLLHISRDNGQNWQNITPPNIPKEGTINMIELSAHAKGRALIAVYKYRENDFKPYIFLTNDYGKNWKLLTNGKNGIPEDFFVRVVREDPFKKGLLYAGTEFGMFFSPDEGANWYPFQLNLPVTPITDMVIKNKDLVVATQGRSFWILDDLSPLHQLDLRASNTPNTLLQPETAYRTQFSNFRGEAAPDPAPNGAVIYFTLNNADEKVTLKIADAQGQVRRTFSTQPDRSKNEGRLSAKPGLNRFVWDLKYEGLEPQPGSFFSLANTGGIMAPTGKHTAILEVGKTAFQQDFQLAKDPRWSVSDADLMAQYELGMDIKTTFNNCHSMIGQLRTIRTQVKEAAKRSKTNKLDDNIQQQANTIATQLDDLEAKLIQTRNEAGQDPINYPSMIDDQFAYLYSVVNAQDDRPNQGAYDRLQDLKKELATLEEAFKTILDTSVRPFNLYLGKSGLTLIDTP